LLTNYPHEVAPGSSSTYEELDEEYKEAAEGGLFNETGKYFKDNLRIGDVELNGLRMALTNELHLDPLLKNSKDSHPFLELTPLLGIGPNSSVLKAMIEQGMIKSPGFSFWQEKQQPSDCFKPAGADKCIPKSEFGTLLLGAIDKSKYEGDLISIDMENEEDRLDNWSTWISRIALDGVTVSTGADPSSFRSISQDSPVMVRYNMGSFSLLPEPMVSQIWDTFGVIAPAPNDGRGYSSQGRVPCDPAKRNKTSTGSIKLRFGGRCGPEVEVPFEDLVSAADDPDSAGAQRYPDDKGENILWCFFDIQKVGYISALGKDVPPEVGAAFWKHMYMVYDFEHGKLAMAKKKKSDGKDDVVNFKSKDASIPGALQYDVNDSTAECKSVAAGGESKDSDSSGDAFHPMKWGLELSYLAMALPFLF
jgi:hypothetical protein